MWSSSSNHKEYTVNQECNLLVGGWATPLKNMIVNWDDDIPNICKNRKCSKSPTRYNHHVIAISSPYNHHILTTFVEPPMNPMEIPIKKSHEIPDVTPTSPMMRMPRPGPGKGCLMTWGKRPGFFPGDNGEFTQKSLDVHDFQGI